VYAAIYEFQWPEALAAFRRAHLRRAKVHVLYDGIHDPTRKGGSTTKKNEAAITKAKVEGLCEPRTTGSIMHNKFVVLVRDKKPVAVWTGSTNLTENGIFGHSNVGHIVEGKTAAAQYLAYWKELRTSPQSKDEKAWMGEHNPAPPDPADPVEDLDIVFSPHQGDDVLDWYADIAKSAKDALFMSFAFGMDERFQEAYRQDDDKLRVALMEDFGGTTKEQKAKAKAAITAIRKRRNVVVAVGNRLRLNSFDRWLAERGGLTNNVEWIHTKYALVDPLGPDPVVITGSANFSTASTSSNNENMLVIRGNTRVADIYLGEYMRLYNHYAFREMVQRAVDEKVPVGMPQYLVPSASWQDDYFVPGARSLRRCYFADGTLS
jgi:phosphatidylserine/phosphatidylglycerophosphate/cardiolipin synthase-like enzyme